jgi:gamma-glutamyltranspeptidase/glutathione hydrolase
VGKLGSGKLSVADVLAPAIRLADEGVPVSELHSHAVRFSLETMLVRVAN